MRLILPIGILVAVALSAAQAGATEEAYARAVRQYFVANVQSWAEDPLIVDAVKVQNIRHAALKAQDIVALDSKWRSEATAAHHPTVDAVLKNKVSAFLDAKQEASEGMITEVFVVDDQGLNVGQSAMTSDYWQGDEAKFQLSYGVGPHGLFIDRPEIDASTQLLQSQVSMTLTDEKGMRIGSITVGINLDKM